MTCYLYVTAEAGMVRQRDRFRAGARSERWSDFMPSVVESVATAMSPNNHIIPSGSENATQLIPGCLEALSSRRLLRDVLAHRGGGGLRGSRRPWLRVGAHRACPPKLELWGPERPGRPPSQTGYFNVLVENSAQSPS